MNTIINIIGAFVLSAILFAIPILTTCAFVYNWGSFIAYLLTLISIVEFSGLVTCISIQAMNER